MATWLIARVRGRLGRGRRRCSMVFGDCSATVVDYSVEGRGLPRSGCSNRRLSTTAVGGRSLIKAIFGAMFERPNKLSGHPKGWLTRVAELKKGHRSVTVAPVALPGLEPDPPRMLGRVRVPARRGWQCPRLERGPGHGDGVRRACDRSGCAAPTWRPARRRSSTCRVAPPVEDKCVPCAQRARRLRKTQIREGWHRTDEPAPAPQPAHRPAAVADQPPGAPGALPGPSGSGLGMRPGQRDRRRDPRG